MADGTLAPLMVSQNIKANSNSMTGNPHTRLVTYAVNGAVHCGPGGLAGARDGARGQALGLGINGLDEMLVQVAGDFLTPTLRLPKNLLGWHW